MDEIELIIRTRYGSFGANCKISPILVESFEPLKITDIPIISAITGEELVGSERVQIIVKRRKDAAEEISKTLTTMILEAMHSNDTLNGYPLEKEY